MEEGKLAMGSIKSKAIMVFLVITLLTISPILTAFAKEQPNISKREWCMIACEMSCYPKTSPDQPCMQECMKRCMGHSLAINYCNLGCVITSCLKPNFDMKSMEGCASLCPKDCKAS
ncbi:uncharacterized protein LOC116212838 [Punica granatum]|uniref:Uncharacterized protein LOC116212838 n=1 Tax=Punica granatum TaxID=22663 RepID=A0A6P8EA47_PUNGR|nr:uncharacterized protein LOC116212838 [Punica granatum]